MATLHHLKLPLQELCLVLDRMPTGPSDPSSTSEPLLVGMVESVIDMYFADGCAGEALLPTA